eukprot:TRINITY_DN13738_c0_g2_i3.p1 TRINITY_DN13738_c0_g2~~TRINITY_DN13738_c0_g2_i3.p1  ORF type:complete len:290 (+),score=42.58 TRINITY_DN13738_c0_g2_i3:374-1243(+)
MVQFKSLVERDQEYASQLLRANPRLAKALHKIQKDLGIDTEPIEKPMKKQQQNPPPMSQYSQQSVPIESGPPKSHPPPNISHQPPSTAPPKQGGGYGENWNNFFTPVISQAPAQPASFPQIGGVMPSLGNNLQGIMPMGAKPAHLSMPKPVMTGGIMGSGTMFGTPFQPSVQPHSMPQESSSNQFSFGTPSNPPPAQGSNYYDQGRAPSSNFPVSSPYIQQGSQPAAPRPITPVMPQQTTPVTTPGHVSNQQQGGNQNAGQSSNQADNLSGRFQISESALDILQNLLKK